MKHHSHIIIIHCTCYKHKNIESWQVDKLGGMFWNFFGHVDSCKYSSYTQQMFLIDVTADVVL